MAKYTVMHTCGHSERVDLIGKVSSREWRKEQLEKCECYECYKAALTQSAQEEAQQQELPPLEGTEKQVAWAETIRLQKLQELHDTLSTLPLPTASDPLLLRAVDVITHTVSAHQWIAWRDDTAKWIVTQTCKSIEQQESLSSVALVNAQPQKTTAVRQEVLAEATIRPETPITETVAELRFSGNTVEVVFPEKREDFRELVRFQLGYTWSDEKRLWKRDITPKNGTPEDRAIEVGHALLGHGFPVRVFQEHIRTKIISGDFDPECTRWITKQIAIKEYEGWFTLSWGKDADFYRVAKRLKRSRYIGSNAIVIPPEQFEAVLDFASLHSFRVSAKAQEVAEQARALQESMLIVKVEKTPKRVKKVIPNTPQPLAIPEEVGILEEFRETL